LLTNISQRTSAASFAEARVLLHPQLRQHVAVPDLINFGFVRDSPSIWWYNCVLFIRQHEGSEALPSFLQRPPSADPWGDLVDRLVIATDLLDGIVALHEAGYTHGSISSCNVLVLHLAREVRVFCTCLGQLLNYDFSVCRTGEDPLRMKYNLQDNDFDPPEAAELANTASFESLRLADLYSFGVVLQQLFHGVPNPPEPLHAFDSSNGDERETQPSSSVEDGASGAPQPERRDIPYFTRIITEVSVMLTASNPQDRATPKEMGMLFRTLQFILNDACEVIRGRGQGDGDSDTLAAELMKMAVTEAEGNG
jgi:serine/threonine protein kinase